jgi:S-adenosylmethionine:tRNA ribosyltransferase-isomerase
MKTADFDFTYPSELIAVEPSRPTRVAFCARGEEPVELDMAALLARFEPGDLLVVNESKVIPARVFTKSGQEILFLQSSDSTVWEVLFAARDFKVGQELELPGGFKAKLEKKGLPQVIRTSRPLTPIYFYEFGELALPPYIQQARGERHNLPNESDWYQPQFAEKPGSVAAPTASLHFSNAHLTLLKNLGVEIGKITLHVGAGTFFPVKSEDLSAHVMHSERVMVPHNVTEQIARVKEKGGRVWALGTTVTRALESYMAGRLQVGSDGFSGSTDLFIYPPYEFQCVDVLMTNFHQPRSTLLCLVSAFAGLERVKQNYQWAIERKFKLFSYGDLTVWTK